MTDGKGLIVLMTKATLGIVLIASSDSYEDQVGNYSEGWDMDCFHDCNDKITIQNR